MFEYSDFANMEAEMRKTIISVHQHV